MIDVLNAYVMRDSSVPWLGAVPAGWQVVPLCAIARMKSITGQVDRELLSVYLNRGVVRFTDVAEKRTNVTSEDLSKYQAVDPGDFVLNNQQAWRGSVGVSRHVGIVSPAYLVLSLSSQLEPAYADLLFRGRAMVDQYLISSRGVGTIQRNLYWPSLKRVPTLLPPLSEQAAIVRFLDHADRKVRRYIRAKKKLITLLNEQKQAVIHRTVTRGLDPNVRLKPSGIDWLGTVPEHWEVRKLSSLFRRHGSGTTPAGDLYYGGGISWVMTGDLKDGLVSRTTRTVTTLAVENVSALRMYPAGSLIVAMYGASIGKTGVLSMDACTNQACCVLAEPDSRANVRYFQAAVNVARSALVEQSYGGGQPNINSEIVRSLRLPVPPREEQDQIVAAICGIAEQAALERANREIALIDEYHVRLVADVVTGKIDVREAAAHLPDEPATLEDEAFLPEDTAEFESAELDDAEAEANK